MYFLTRVLPRRVTRLVVIVMMMRRLMMRRVMRIGRQKL